MGDVTVNTDGYLKLAEDDGSMMVVSYTMLRNQSTSQRGQSVSLPVVAGRSNGCSEWFRSPGSWTHVTDALYNHLPHQEKPSKHKMYNVGPTSKTLVRRCTNVIKMFCVCWEQRGTIIRLIGRIRTSASELQIFFWF